MDGYLTKIIAALAMLVVTLVFGLLPIVLARRASNGGKWRWQKALALMNSAAGGVFLSLFLIHLLPPVHDGLTKSLRDYGIITSFPVPEFVTSIGFFIVLITELLFSKFHVHAPDRENTENTVFYNNCEENIESETGDNSVRISNDAKYGSVTSAQTDMESSLCNDKTILNTPRTIPQTLDSSSHTHDLELQANTPIMRAFVMILAVSVHYTFEGLAVGLQETNAKVWMITMGVLSHKWVIAVGLGIRLAQSPITTCRHVLFITSLSLMSPVGIAIGIGVSNIDDNEITRNLVAYTLEALATGTFLYITFFEVLDKDAKGALNVLCMILGFSVLTALAFVE